MFGTKGISRDARYEGYGGLVEAIARFFHTGRPLISVDEMIELFAFMEAADESRRRPTPGECCRGGCCRGGRVLSVLPVCQIPRKSLAMAPGTVRVAARPGVPASVGPPAHT